MKLKLLIIIIGISAQVSYGMQEETSFTMPSKEVLEQRLRKNGFDHFMEKTNIISQLAGQKKVALGVAMAVELSLYDYSENLKNPMMDKMMQMRKGQLLETLLQDNPKAIAELRSLKIVESSKN